METVFPGQRDVGGITDRYKEKLGRWNKIRFPRKTKVRKRTKL